VCWRWNEDPGTPCLRVSCDAYSGRTVFDARCFPECWAWTSPLHVILKRCGFLVHRCTMELDWRNLVLHGLAKARSTSVICSRLDTTVKAFNTYFWGHPQGHCRRWRARQNGGCTVRCIASKARGKLVTADRSITNNTEAGGEHSVQTPYLGGGTQTRDCGV